MGEPTREHVVATRRQGHEPETASVRGLVIFTIALVVSLGLISLLTWGILVWYTRPAPAPEYPVRVELPEAVPSVPHWEDPDGDYAAYTARQLELLEGYAWVDRERGIVRIPLDEAMRLYAQRMAPIEEPEASAGPEVPASPGAPRARPMQEAAP